MKLYEGYPYWSNTYLRTNSYVKKDMEEETDILVVGGGMSGVLASYVLSKEGHKVILIDKNKIGEGSSSLNTGLIQYMSDIGLSDLSDQEGVEFALKFYKDSLLALDFLEEINKDILKHTIIDPEFKRVNSIYVAAEPSSIDMVKDEYKAQKLAGFPVSFLNQRELLKTYGVKGYDGIVTHNDILLNPYKYVIGVAETAISRHKLNIYENCELVNYDDKKSHVIANVKLDGKIIKIKTKKLIIATGYDHIPKIDKFLVNKKLVKTYAAITSPIDVSRLSKENYMYWETKRPYTYMRKTFDDRMVLGGLDQIKLKMSKRELKKKIKELVKACEGLIPDLKGHLHPEFYYVAIFGESKDNLPTIDFHPKDKNVFIIAGLGGNGTVYSAMAAKQCVKKLNL